MTNPRNRICCLDAAAQGTVQLDLPGFRWGSTAEQGPDLTGKLVLGKWLGEKRRGGLEQSSLKYLRSEARHIEDRLSGPALLHLPAQLTTGHAGHFDVGQDQMDAAGVLLAATLLLPILGYLPRAVLSAVIMVIAVQHVDPSTIQLVKRLVSGRVATPGSLVFDLFVIVLVVGINVVGAIDLLT